MNNPLKGWLPGLLSDGQIKRLCDDGWIDGLENVEQIDPSAVDLTLSNEVYSMPCGSVKPFGESYAHFVLRNETFARRLEAAPDGSFCLKKQETFVFRLKEELGRALLTSGHIFGQATAKSSIGRVDVLARLIVDGMDCYESFNPARAAKMTGRMFLEVTPITFDVHVRPGCSLSQLRFFYGDPSDCEVKGAGLYGSVLSGGLSDGYLSVDLSNTEVGAKPCCAFRAKSNDTPVCLWEIADNDKPDPRLYWDQMESFNQDGNYCFTIEKERFYILRSKEAISLPAGVAVYCRAIDETIGEMRIHYAGFVHPNFGFNRPDGQPGTPLIFEVRGHDVKVTLRDGEKMAKLTFYRLSEIASAKDSPYAQQTLQLSKFFGPWR